VHKCKEIWDFESWFETLISCLEQSIAADIEKFYDCLITNKNTRCLGFFCYKLTVECKDVIEKGNWYFNYGGVFTYKISPIFSRIFKNQHRIGLSGFIGEKSVEILPNVGVFADFLTPNIVPDMLPTFRAIKLLQRIFTEKNINNFEIKRRKVFIFFCFIMYNNQ
jgi:hypothetical protein